MNIAFGAVLIVALLYPGVIFRILYLRGVDLVHLFRSSPKVPLFKGQIQYSNYRDVNKSKFRIFGQDVIWIHVLSESKEQSIIYDGFLWDYELTDTNGLDRIILFNVSKRSIRKQISGFKHPEEARFRVPAGESFLNQEAFELQESEEIGEQLVVFPYNQIKNLTITYVDLNEVGNDA